MNIRKITKHEVAFDEEELKVIMNCLDYCYHRITKHGKFLNSQKSCDSINNLRKDIREFLELTN